MKGSEKQVKWAMDIVKEAKGQLDNLDKMNEKEAAQYKAIGEILKEDRKEVKAATEVRRQIEEVLKYFADQDDAKKIIDFRNKISGYAILKMWNGMIGR